MLLENEKIIDLLKTIFPFNKASEPLLEMAAKCFEIDSFNENEIIFCQNDRASKLYILFNGKVKITHVKRGIKQDVGVLKRGDLFGLEMLEYERLNVTTAEAQTQCVCLVLDRDHAKVLLSKIPDFNAALEILFESYLLSLEKEFIWLNEGEAIYYVARKHRMNMFLRIIFPIVFAGISLPLLSIFSFGLFPDLLTPILIIALDGLFTFIWLIWSLVDWRNDYALITSQRVVYLEKVVMLYDSRQEAPLSAILAVSTKTDQIGRIFGYGDVVIRTYAGEIILPKVKNYQQVSDLMTAQWVQSSSRRAQAQKDNIEEKIKERLGLIPKSMEADTPPETVQQKGKSGAILNRLANLFQLRVYAGESITYRTHWFMLLKRTWFPSLMILALIVVLIARLMGMFEILSMSAICGLESVFSIILFGWWIYEYLDWRNDAYIVTPEQVIDINKKPLGKEEKRTAPLKNILSIEFERLGVLGLLLNYGTVYIRVGETTLTFDYVFNPAEVQRELFKRLADVDQKEKQAQLISTQQHVADWIAAYHKVTDENQANPGLQMD
ncbi:MAG: cyclic nucleotide-binding domain-containing protein [Anaerolineaceae bacterium]|nr:cyclic nucleotide-binding domain-containing protein [Anaerolineaceae bacterium]